MKRSSQHGKILVIHGADRLSSIVASYAKPNYSSIYKLVDPNYYKPAIENHVLHADYPIITTTNDLGAQGTFDYVSSIGYKCMRSRKDAFISACHSERLKAVNIIHPHALIADSAMIGKGNIFFPGVIVEDGVRIGDNNIFWSNTCICHDSAIGSHNFIAASSTVGGLCTLGDSVFMGFGSILNETLTITSNCFLASGSVVIDSVLTPGSRLCGVPARLMSKTQPSLLP